MPAPTYINNGDAGNREGHYKFTKNQPEWSAFRSDCYSYSRFDVYNSTHIHFRQTISDDEGSPCNNGDIMDDVMYIQHNHGPFKANYGDISKMETTIDINKGVTFDPYKENGIELRIAKIHDEDTLYIPYISNNKDDYIDVEPLHL